MSKNKGVRNIVGAVRAEVANRGGKVETTSDGNNTRIKVSGIKVKKPIVYVSNSRGNVRSTGQEKARVFATLGFTPR